jgi:hypothetical protein
VDRHANAESRAPQSDRYNIHPPNPGEIAEAVLCRAKPKTVNGQHDIDSLRLLLSGPAAARVRQDLAATLTQDYAGGKLRAAVDAARLAERAAIKAATVAEQTLAAHEAHRAELQALLETP